MQNSELFKIACQCLILNENPRFKNELKNKILAESIDLEKFVFLCSNHLVLPAIYLRLYDLGVMNSFDPDFQSHLKDIYELNLKRNSEIFRQIKEICSILDKYNIEPVFLKGTANLLDNLYSNFGDRMIGDIDFLVRDKDYFKTAEILRQSGFRQTDEMIFDELNQIYHYPRLYRDDVPADIEIHRVPVKKNYAVNFDNDKIFEKKIKIENINNCYITCDEHKLIHTFIHSQLSNKGYSYRIASLRDLYDFYLISKRVDFYSVLPEIEERNKAIGFHNLTQHLFENAINKEPLKSISGTRYLRQVNWFMNHPFQHRFYINVKKVVDIFIERPLNKLKNAFLYKETRKSLLNRFINPVWYKTIYAGIKSHFK